MHLHVFTRTFIHVVDPHLCIYIYIYIMFIFIYMLFVREDDVYIYMNVVDLRLLDVRINQILCL